MLILGLCFVLLFIKLSGRNGFHDRGPYHIETSQWTGFCIIGVSVMKELRTPACVIIILLIKWIKKKNLQYISVAVKSAYVWNYVAGFLTPSKGSDTMLNWSL